MASIHSDYYSTAEYAKIFGITVAGVNKQIKAGKIKAEKNKQNNYIIYKKDLPPVVLKKMEKLQREKLKKVEAVDASDIHALSKALWGAADALRGSVDSADYKNIVLGLIFLKYLNDTFVLQQQKIQEDAMKNPNVDVKRRLQSKSRYLSEGVFMIPDKAQWSFLQDNSGNSDISQIIDDAMRVIEAENPEQLQDVLPKEFVRINLEPSIITELINRISSLTFGKSIEEERDALGQVYEYFLGEFADAEGKRGGEFYTPPTLVRLLVEILQPQEHSRIFDPACGSGGMFVQSYKYIKDHHGRPDSVHYYGQESNERTHKLAKMNLVLRGIESTNVKYGDSHTNDLFSKDTFDFVLANPPFNQEWRPESIAYDDPRVQYGKPRKTNANFFWIQHFITHLNDKGKAGFVMANGSLSSVSGIEGEARKDIIEDDLVEIIVSCPTKLFYNTGIPCCLWFISKDKGKRKGETLFIDASKLGEEVSRKNVQFTPKDIKRVVDVIDRWKKGRNYTDEPGFCHSATTKEIADNNYVLTPGRYIQPEKIEDTFDFKERYTALQQEYTQQVKQGRQLDKRIEANLKKIDV